MAGTATKPEVLKGEQPAQTVPEDAAFRAQENDRMRVYFASRPKVTVKLRADEWVQINGYTFIIKAGERVEVPVDVADLLDTAGLL